MLTYDQLRDLYFVAGRSEEISTDLLEELRRQMRSIEAQRASQRKQRNDARRNRINQLTAEVGRLIREIESES